MLRYRKLCALFAVPLGVWKGHGDENQMEIWKIKFHCGS